MLRRDFLSAGAAIFAGLVWILAPDQVVCQALLGLAGFGLAFIAPPWALVLLAWSAPFEQPLEIGGFTVYTPELLLAAMLPGVLWQMARQRAWRKPLAPIALWAAPFVAVLAVSAFSAHTWPALKGALRWLEFLLALSLCVYLLRRGREAERVVWALVLAAAFSATQGLLETLGGPSMHPALATIRFMGQDVTKAAAGYGAGTLAMLLALVLPWCVGSFFYSAPQASSGRATGIQQPYGRLRSLRLLCAALLLAGLVATFSFTGAVALAVSAAIMLPAWSFGWKKPKTGLALVLLAGILLFGLLSAGHGFWNTKLASWHDRWDYARVAIRLFTNAPWFGIGPGQYRFLAPAFGPGINPVGLLTHPHSLYLSILAELGGLGLLAFLWLLAAGAGFLLRGLKGLPAGRPRTGLLALIAGLAGFAAANFFDHGLVHDRGVHAALLAGCALVLSRRPARPLRPERRRVFDAAWPASAPAPEAWQAHMQERRQGRAQLHALLEQALAGQNRARILELGCGPALDALHLAGCKQYEVHAADQSAAALQLAAAAAAELKRPLLLHQADVRHTGLPAGTFDLVFSQGLLEHFPDPGPVWIETARLLKPGGFAVVDVPQTWNPYTLAKLWHYARGDWPWGWETQYSLSRLKAEARLHGLEPVAWRGYGYRGGLLDITAWPAKLGAKVAPRAWQAWELATGAWWMMNLAALFKKR